MAKLDVDILTDEIKDTIIKEMVKNEFVKYKNDIYEKAINDAAVLMFTLPLTVLMDNYCSDENKDILPEFANLLVEYFNALKEGKIDINKCKEALWNYGGIKLMEED